MPPLGDPPNTLKYRHRIQSRGATVCAAIPAQGEERAKGSIGGNSPAIDSQRLLGKQTRPVAL